MLPILIKKKDGKYYDYSNPTVESAASVGILVGPGSGHVIITNSMYNVTRVVTDELKSIDAETIEVKAFFNLPTVNYNTYRQVLSFLRQVYDKHRSEGAVLLVLNRNAPLKDQEYRVVVPKQSVSGASVDYKDIDQIPLVDGEFLAGSIHSHPMFGAFQSSTDHRDEISFDGLHLTFGHIDKAIPEIHTRLCFAGRVYEKIEKPMIEVSRKEGIEIHGFDLIVSELADTITKAGLDIDKKDLSKAIINVTKPKVEENVPIPAEWMEQVSSKVTVIHGNYANGYDWRQAHNPTAMNGAAKTYLGKYEPNDDLISPDDFCIFLYRSVIYAKAPDIAMVRQALLVLEPSEANLKSYHITIDE